MDEYGRIHTDGSRSGGQPTQREITPADTAAMESILWVDTIIDDQEAIAKVFARHRQYGYDQGYYDGQRDRPPTQSDALREALEAVWKEATTMRNASKLIGPYPKEPANNRVWARSMYHAGKKLHELIKPVRAALGEKQ